VSSGQTRETSAILKFDPLNGTFIGRFDHGNSPLFRPYGLAFSPDNRELFVSSFLTDQLLVFDMRTGDFKRVLLQGNGLSGGLNGPNGLLFGSDGFLYCSTEGSIATDGKPIFPGLPSQILRINTTSGESSVFIDSAKVLNASLGYSNYLGLQIGPGGDLYISDFGNDVHIYTFPDGNEKGRILTSWTGAPAKNAIGSLTFNPKGILYVAGFLNTVPGNPGAILRYDARSGKPLPAAGQPGAVFVPASGELQKPIGILWVPY
jgi:DNA-binding beta-propeller fold protein YncE